MIAFDNPSANLRWFETQEGRWFLDYVEELLDLSIARLEKETDITQIYRRQGRIDALKDILNLPEQFREMIKKGVQ